MFDRKEYYTRNKEKIRAYRKEYDIKNPWKRRIEKWNKRGIKITVDEYINMIKQQNGLCAICGNVKLVLKGTRKNRAACVDHDHKSGKIRGVLCYNCNTAVGNVKDSSEIAIKLVEYLKKHGC